MTRLHDLYEIGGQSPWLDNLRRDWLDDGQLAELVSLGVRGITSNPTIFANAISGQDAYDTQFKELMKDHTVDSAYWELAITDIVNGLELLRPTYENSDGEDGYVSLEVSPALAHDTESTVRDARKLHTRIAKPNLLVKVPGTKEGVPAIKTLISEGRNINVTLIFGLDRYDEVIEAYISGLEALVKAGRTEDLPTWPASPRSSSAGSTPRSTADWRRWPVARVGTPGSWPCGARRRWPRPRWPTSTSTLRSPPTAGRHSTPWGRGCSGPCGRRRRRRTPPTPICSTSTA